MFSDKNAANGKTVTVSGTTLLDTATGLASNYTVSNPTGLTASITAKALTVTGQLAGNKVYDGNAQAQPVRRRPERPGGAAKPWALPVKLRCSATRTRPMAKP